MDDAIAQFCSITDASPTKAESYLKVSDGDLAQALQLFFDTGGADIDIEPLPTQSAPSAPSRPAAPDVISINDDEDDLEGDDVKQAMRASERTSAPSSGPGYGSYEDDEMMARRLQEEFYGVGASGGTGEGGMDNGVRAPIPRTTETLVGGMDDEDYDYEPYPPAPRGRPGIFNQRTTVWNDSNDPILSTDERRRRLAAATGGDSEQSSKASSLAEMFRPPFEIISHLPFDEAREEAKELERWILVNIQEQSVFDSQVLNRDIWKAPEVQSTVRENFIFLQMDRQGRDGRDYIRLYMPQASELPGSMAASSSLFPHIAIIDPRTGEQVKVWAEMPKTSIQFVHELHEFLDRYSLNPQVKNPVQRKTKPKVDVDHMTEEEMMQMAMQASLGGSTGGQGHDPDELTKGGDEDMGDLMDFTDEVEAKGKAVELSPFQKISKDKHHTEPPPGPETTRIQFKLHDGSRAVRRFLLGDTIERLFEYVKADLLPEQAAKHGDESGADKEFELVSLGKRLIEALDKTVEEAGLKMGTIMVETVEH